jgi:2-dehydropantoate 2-reductase
VEYVRVFGQKIPGARPSMLLDHLAKRRSEIDVINGAVPRVGAEVGVPTPVNETVVALVRARESGFAPAPIG